MIFYFEDLKVGARYRSTEKFAIDEQNVMAFAREFDPQPFHLDPEAAAHSIFGRLVASGWQTASLTMRMNATSELQLAGGWIGLGVESMEFNRPVLPGDVLESECEILETRRSKSKPEFGIIKIRTVTSNQRGEPVLTLVANQIVERRRNA